MKALLSTVKGPPSSLVIDELPEPVPGPGEVVVAVKAAALNFFDTLIIEDRYQFRPERPFSPSAECAGTVHAIGKDVTSWAVGDRAALWAGWGCAREKVVAKAQDLLRIPDALSDAQAAGLFVTYGTGLHALVQRGALKAGETLVVMGAAGGTGLAAVELGVLLGARVIACASSDEKLELARAHGAHELLNYETENLREGLRRLTGKAGVDVLYDPVGGDLAELALRSMGWGGRYLVVGFAGGAIPKLPLNLLLLKGCDLRGVFWGDFVAREPEANHANMERLLAWAAAGKLRAHVHGSYMLDQAAEAFALIAERKAQGKVILTP
ncbi:MAG: NADPH:quinone oxidoreductase family protein [Bosea sp. (in: a-proteobacteria)]